LPTPIISTTSFSTAQIAPGFIPGRPTGAIPGVGGALRTLQGSNKLIYPTELPKYFMRLQYNQYNRTSALELGQMNELGNIFLPLPHNLIDTLNVSYDKQALGGIGVEGASGFAGQGVITADPRRQGQMNGNAGNMLSDPSSWRSYLGNMIQQNPNAPGAQIGQAILGAGSNLASQLPAIQAIMGVAPNQFLTILLQGPEYKVFELQWKFAPETPQESETLRRLINTIKRHSSPKLGFLGAVWGFPEVWQLAILPDPQFMIKYKPSVCTNFTANYTPAGQPSFLRPDPGTGGHGAPAIVDIAMRFIELEYWLDTDFIPDEVLYGNSDPWSGTISRGVTR
jgi:hypothetical protein